MTKYRSKKRRIADNSFGRTHGNTTTRKEFTDSELVIALAGAVGTDLNLVTKLLEERLQKAGYEVEHIHVADEVIDLVVPERGTPIPRTDRGSKNFQSTSFKMTRGTLARKRSGDNSILALGAASVVLDHRPKGERKTSLIAARRAYVIKSLKHPDEVMELRQIYPQSFYLIGVHSDRTYQEDFLVQTKGMTQEEADTLIERDRNENVKYGQHLIDTFQLSDFFVRLGEKPNELRDKIWRFLSLLFANPHCTPEFEEYAMFLAFSASLRSTALARQVGAVIARNKEVLSTGANDLPLFGGGLHWAESNLHQGAQETEEGHDVPKTEIDQNTAEKQKLLEDIVASGVKRGLPKTKLRNLLQSSGIMEITEYGREVHAEMEALLCCVRNAISTRDADLYTTTFPCHNCTKHIVAAGIKRVVFVEPYSKSKAMTLHGDVVTLKGEDQGARKNAVTIEPYVGVGPRRFFDLYSIRHGSGRWLDRKDEEGHALEWNPAHCDLRHQMRPNSYLDLELNAASMFKKLRELCAKNRNKTERNLRDGKRTKGNVQKSTAQKRP